ncbi:MAG: WD40 repeat domain-containing protein [Burkholderiales bacterium]
MKAAIAAVLVLCSCSNLMKAQSPTHRHDNAHLFGATAVAFSPTGEIVASGGLRGEIALWRIGANIARLKAHRDAVRALEFVSDERFVSSGDDGRIILWNLSGREALVERQSSAVTAMVLAGDNIVTGHADGHVRAWTAFDLQPVHSLRLDSAVLALAVHGSMLAMAGEDGAVALFSPELNLLRRIQVSGPAAHDLQFSPDGKWLAAGSWFRLLVWNVDSGERRSIASEHNGLLASLDFSPDGDRLVSLGRHTDSALRVWDTRNFAVERRYQAHDLCGAMVRFSPDGRFIASVSDDESVRLYDLQLPYDPR